MKQDSIRIGCFDAIKAFAMFLVIWGHCILHLTSWDRLDDTTFVIINSFHMPLFMVVSGYFSASSLEIGFKTLSWKKFKSLIIPCICWCLLLSVETYLTVGKILFANLVETFIMKYWFLRSLFCCYLLAFFLFRSPRWLAVLVFCFCLIITLYNLNIMFPAFMCGLMIRKKNLLENSEFSSYLNVILISILFIFLTYFYDAHVLNSPNRMGNIIISNSASLWGVYFYKTFYRIAVGVCGAYLIIIMMYKNFRNISGVVCNIGQRTMGIYLIQGIVLERIMSHTITYTGGALLFDLVLAPLLSVVLMFIFYYLVLQIERKKRISKFLLGR